jgi:hypothetical protein
MYQSAKERMEKRVALLDRLEELREFAGDDLVNALSELIVSQETMEMEVYETLHSIDEFLNKKIKKS